MIEYVVIEHARETDYYFKKQTMLDIPMLCIFSSPLFHSTGRGMNYYVQ